MGADFRRNCPVFTVSAVVAHRKGRSHSSRARHANNSITVNNNEQTDPDVYGTGNSCLCASSEKVPASDGTRTKGVDIKSLIVLTPTTPRVCVPIISNLN